MNWLDRFLGKRAMPTTQLYIQQPAHAVSMPRNYTSFADEGYRKNVVAYRAIERITDAMSGVPLKLKRMKPKDKQAEDVLDHPVLELLCQPNPTQSYEAFVKSAFGYFFISGNTYIQAVGPNEEAKREPPKELWALRPDRMSVIPGRTMMPAGYEYKIGADKKKIFPVDFVDGASPIMHLKTFHPMDDYYGMSPIEAAAFSIDQYNAGGKWNLALMQNSARPSGAFVVTNSKGEATELSESQREHLKKEVIAQYTGAGNTGRPMVLEGGLDWKEMGFNPKDMDWINSKDTNARDVCLAFGVPSQLLGIPGDSTYSNYEQAKLAFYLDTVIPALKMWCTSLNSWLVAAYEDEGLYLEPDTNAIEALEPMRKDKWDQTEKAAFLTIDEKRERVGLGKYVPSEEPGGQILVGMSLAPLEVVGASEPVDVSDDELDTEDYTGEPDTTQPKEPAAAGDVDPAETPVQDTALNGAQLTALADLVVRVVNGEMPRESAINIIMVGFLLSREQAEQILSDAGDGFEGPEPDDPAPPPAPAPKPPKEEPAKRLTVMIDGKAVNLSSRRNQQKYRASIMKRRRAFEKTFRSEVAGTFNREMTDMVARLKNVSLSGLENAVDRAVEANEPAMRRTLRKNILRTMRHFGDDVLALKALYPNHIETKDSEERFTSYLDQFIDRYVGQRIKKVSQTTKRRVTEAVRETLKPDFREHEGQEVGSGTSDDVVKAIRQTYKGFSASRAQTIAVTEVSVAQNEASRAAADSLGIPGLEKTWISEMIERSRHNHMAMHEVSVKMTEDFSVPDPDGGTDRMSGPGDPAAPAKQVINCHCVQVFGKGAE